MKTITNSYLSDLNLSYRMGGFSTYPHGVDRHVRDYVFNQNIFYFIVAGTGEITIDGKNYHAEAGDWFFIPAGTQYMYQNNKEKPFIMYWLHFEIYPGTNICEQLGLSNHIHCNEAAHIKTLFRELVGICYIKKPADIIKTKAILLDLMSEYIRLSDCNSSSIIQEPDSYLEIILSYIDKNIQASLTNDFLAKILHMHPNSFIRYFKERMGQTPQQYIMSKRMDLAGQLLKKTTMSLSEIVEATGLYDIAHLSKNFKRFYSTTPSRYRKSVHGIAENE